MWKHIFKGKFMCSPNFLVCAHLTTCARAHAHSLERTLLTRISRVLTFKDIMLCVMCILMFAYSVILSLIG